MRNKNVAAILALFLGMFGIHRFYLGQIGRGILYLFFFWMVPVMFIISIVDMVSLFAMDQEDFDAKYNKKYYNLTRDRADAEYRRRNYRRESPPIPSIRDIGEEPPRRRRREEAPPRAPRRRRPPAPPENTAAKKAYAFKKSGVEKYKDFDFEEAIIDFEKALAINPEDKAVHFNLACAYSLTEQKTKSYHHLGKAVALGFNDFEKIQTHDALAYIRIQEEYDGFVKNGYKVPTTPKLNTQVDSNTLDVLQQLQQLASLRERSLISEEEFVAQKKRLLS